LAAGGAAEAERFAAFLATTNLSADDQKDILTGLSQAQEDHAKATANSAVADKFFGETSEEKSKRLEDEKKALEEAAKAEDEAKGVKVGEILAGNMKADEVLDALDGLRPQIQAKVADAFAAGGPEAATAVADDYVNQIVKALGGKLTADQVKELLGLSDLQA